MKNNYVGIILGLLGIVCIIVAYTVIWNSLGEKTDAVKVENDALQAEVDRLQDLADHKEQYINDTKTMKEEDEKIIAQFPADVKPEDEILYADETEKNSLQLDITAISMPGSSVIEVAAPSAPAAEEAVTDEATGEETGEIVENTVTESEPTKPSNMLYQTPVTVTVRTAYSTLKDVLTRITKDGVNKKSVDMVNMAFSEETGNLEGTVTYNMYSLTGTDKTYESPKTPGVAVGTNDLFDTQARLAAILAEKAAGQAAAAAKSAAAAAQ
ncbi:MAG: hypothetical protein IK078_09010 [Lachnospiraceae bacterium]|nr:hypothetical protein [Lachnospiraceae bacterium]